MKRRLSKEDKQVIADSIWWEELEVVKPWRLIGFTFRKSAIFSTDDYNTLTLLPSQRDQILSAIREAR